MYAVISSERIQLPPGTVVHLPGTWQDYLALCESRGDGSIPRIKYRSGEIVLMSPLPKHGRDAHLIANVVTVLLDSQNRNYEAFTPITMSLPEESGIEPDYCFYIERWQAAVGKDRLNWGIDPPPDLVIEIDVTSYSSVNDYLPYRVPEVWLFKRNQLAIHELHNDAYQLRSESRFFPGTDLRSPMSRCLQTAAEQGTGVAIRELRQSLL
ncbi:MAG: Uma2 family endonuclease [Stenomitos rutilans HA7619-LM2]|nr:Uma2 family endonuclease [Stenomitos rutilans HA7619-LM2]